MHEHFQHVKKLKKQGLGEQFIPETSSALPLAPTEMLYAIMIFHVSNETLNGTLRLCLHFITRPSCISVFLTHLKVCIY